MVRCYTPPVGDFTSHRLAWAGTKAISSRAPLLTSAAIWLIDQFVRKGKVDRWALMRVLALVVGVYLSFFFYNLWKVRHGTPKEIRTHLGELALRGGQLHSMFDSTLRFDDRNWDVLRGQITEIGGWHAECTAYLRSIPMLGEEYVNRLYSMDDIKFPEAPLMAQVAEGPWQATYYQPIRLREFAKDLKD
jgi:hypothetical protein